MREAGRVRATRRWAALVLAVALGSTLAGTPAAEAGEIAVGVTGGANPELVVFDTDAPGSALVRRPVNGLVVGETLSGLDLRPATGQFFVLTSLLRIATLDPATGDLTQLGGTLTTTPQFPPGQVSGLDFNPTVDRLRLVNAVEDNLRYNPFTFAPVDSDGNAANGNTPDTDLAFDAGDPNAGQNPNVAAEAYDRNDNDPATATTLWAIDSGLDLLVRQGGSDGVPSPNLGGLFTIGPLGVNVTDVATLDIVPGTPGSPAAGAAYLAAIPLGSSTSTLYEVDLTPPGAGQLAALGAFGDPLIGMAIAIGGGLAFSATSTVVGESASQAVVTVARRGETLGAGQVSGTVQVPFRTVDRTAIAGRDYTAVSGVLEFAAGETAEQVTVPLLGDAKDESAETFAIELGRPTGGAILLAEEHTVEIADNDSPALELLIAVKTPRSLRTVARAKGLRARFACSNACAAKLRLKLGRKLVGTGKGTLNQPGVKATKVKLTKKGRKLVASALGRTGTVKLKLDCTASDAGGSSARDRAVLRIPVG